MFQIDVFPNFPSEIRKMYWLYSLLTSENVWALVIRQHNHLLKSVFGVPTLQFTNWIMFNLYIQMQMTCQMKMKNINRL